MSSQSTKLAKNLFSLTFGKSASLVLNVIALIFVAKHLGAEEFGYFSGILSTIIILSKIIDLGLVPIVYTEFSRIKPDKTLFSTAFTLRLIAFIIIGIGFNLFFHFSGKATSYLLIANLLYINVIISTKYVNFRELLEVPFKSALKTAIPMFASIIDSLFLFVAVMWMLYTDEGIIYFVVAYAVSNLPGFFILIYNLVKNYGVSFKPQFKSAQWLLINSLPVWGYALVNSVFQQVDIILLANMHSELAAGLYSIAPRLLTPILLAPNIVVTGFYPLLVRYYEENPKVYEILKRNVFKALFLVAFLASAFLTFKATEIILLVFGEEFRKSDFPTILLFWSQIFLFYAFFVKNLLVIYKNHKWNFYESLAVLALNLGLNFWLIPLYAQDGAAIAKLAGAVFSMVVSVYALVISGDKVYLYNFKTILLVISLVFILYLSSGLNLILYTIIFIISVPVLLVIYNYFSDSEIHYICVAINKPRIWERLNKNKVYRIFYKKVEN